MLRVKGSNGNGIWNDYGASLSILVLPPFWATWYFRLVVAGAILGLTGLGLAARLGALRRRNSLLVKFARHIEDAREEERKLAARDVHDEIGQHLTVLNFHAYWLVTHLDSPEAERASRIKEMQGVILDAMGAVKAVATGLRPAALDALDFAGALRWYIRSFQSLSGMAVELEEDWGNCAIQGELTIALFRILQEILGNVMRHSSARKVRIRMGCDGEEAVLDVADDGIGIDPALAARPDSFGIVGMRERCAAFGGGLVISAQPGGGTRVVARLRISPLPAGPASRKRRKAC
jgi:signal transduction histidine kinase